MSKESLIRDVKREKIVVHNCALNSAGNEVPFQHPINE
jgi:uncharacterized Zn-finger protein